MIDSEFAVIGGMLLEPVLITEIDDLAPEDFTLESFRLVYAELLDMAASREVIDIVTAGERLEKKHGGEFFNLLGKCIKACVSTANVKAYAKLVREESRKRRAQQIAGELLNAVPVDGLDAVDAAIRDLMTLTQTRKNHESSIGQVMMRAIEIIQEADSKQGVVGVPSGVEDLDKVLGGFHDSDLYVVGARPAIGKTAVMLNFANNCNVSCGVISAEQPSEQIGLRLIAINGRIDANKMRNGDLEEMDFMKVATTAAKFNQQDNIHLYDKPAPTVLEVIRQARKWKMQHDIKILFVDYIQRIKWTDLRIARHEQVGNVVMCLKELARDLNIPVVALAQVNREVEKRTNKRPEMGDLANSSEIEKEADCIILLYRDEVYEEKTLDKGVMEFDIAKNRHGPIGYKKVVWVEKFMRVENYSPYANEYKQ